MSYCDIDSNLGIQGYLQCIVGLGRVYLNDYNGVGLDFDWFDWSLFLSFQMETAKCMYYFYICSLLVWLVV